MGVYILYTATTQYLDKALSDSYNYDMTIEDLKNKPKITREDIATLLKSIGEPGDKQEEKMQAVQELSKTNRQGHDLSETLESYMEF